MPSPETCECGSTTTLSVGESTREGTLCMPGEGEGVSEADPEKAPGRPCGQMEAISLRIQH